MGYNSEWVHPETIVEVTKAYPRRGWSSCFSKKIWEEMEVKPWAHTTASTDKFPIDVANNKLMAPFDSLT
jgi:cyanamide hydratase